jgi:hypothetical protein
MAFSVTLPGAVVRVPLLSLCAELFCCAHLPFFFFFFSQTRDSLCLAVVNKSNSQWECVDTDILLNAEATIATGSTNILGTLAVIFNEVPIPSSSVVSSTEAEEMEEDEGSNAGVIAGAVIGSVVGVAILGAAAAFFVKKRKHFFRSSHQRTFNNISLETELPALD